MKVPVAGTGRELLVAVLRAAGVDAVYGVSDLGIETTPAPPPLRALLATTHERLVHRRALVADGPSLRTAGPAGAQLVVRSPADLAALPPALAAASGGFTLDLDLDLDAPLAGLRAEPVPPSDRWVEPGGDAAERIDAASAPVVLAGPGVVRAGAVPGLHALAAAGRLGVLNTWGAKGVFDWRSRHHLATIGLQDLDFALGGLGAADLVIAVGIDPDEAPPARWDEGPVLTLDPQAMPATAQALQRGRAWLPVPEIRHRLAAVTQEGWADDGETLAPTAATRNYGTVLGEGGRVAADAGLAGFWVARTFSTTELGSAQVPATRIDGFAAAVALVSRLLTPQRKVLAVVDGAPSAVTLELTELADRLGRGFAVEAWSPDGDRLDAAAHLARLARLAVVERCEVATVAPAGWQFDRITAAAGPVIAWEGQGIDRDLLR